MHIVGHALYQGAYVHQCCSRLHISSHTPLCVLGYLWCKLAIELELDYGCLGVSLVCFYRTVEDTCGRMRGEAIMHRLYVIVIIDILVITKLRDVRVVQLL
jgi:hypothetical protein